jgi:hypothetical protein
MPGNVTLDQVLHVLKSGDNLRFCLACGAEAYGVEPDTRRHTCEACGVPQVYGAEELLFRMSPCKTLSGSMLI